MPFNPSDLTPEQLDALREVGNIGAGHGATALSQLLGKKILITVPQVDVIPLPEIPKLVGDPNTLVAALCFSILGDATGKILLLFPRESALRLADMLLRQPPNTSQMLSEMGHSALKETGNILTGAYLNALNEFLGMLLLMSVPSLVFDMAGVVLSTLIRGEDIQSVICIETRFLDKQDELGGYFLLAPDSPSLRAIFQAIKVKQ